MPIDGIDNGSSTLPDMFFADSEAPAAGDQEMFGAQLIAQPQEFLGSASNDQASENAVGAQQTFDSATGNDAFGLVALGDEIPGSAVKSGMNSDIYDGLSESVKSFVDRLPQGAPSPNANPQVQEELPEGTIVKDTSADDGGSFPLSMPESSSSDTPPISLNDALSLSNNNTTADAANGNGDLDMFGQLFEDQPSYSQPLAGDTSDAASSDAKFDGNGTISLGNSLPSNFFEQADSAISATGSDKTALNGVKTTTGSLTYGDTTIGNTEVIDNNGVRKDTFNAQTKIDGTDVSIKLLPNGVSGTIGDASNNVTVSNTGRALLGAGTATTPLGNDAQLSVGANTNGGVNGAVTLKNFFGDGSLSVTANNNGNYGIKYSNTPTPPTGAFDPSSQIDRAINDFNGSSSMNFLPIGNSLFNPEPSFSNLDLFNFKF